MKVIKIPNRDEPIEMYAGDVVHWQRVKVLGLSKLQLAAKAKVSPWFITAIETYRWQSIKKMARVWRAAGFGEFTLEFVPKEPKQ